MEGILKLCSRGSNCQCCREADMRQFETGMQIAAMREKISLLQSKLNRVKGIVLEDYNQLPLPVQPEAMIEFERRASTPVYFPHQELDPHCDKDKIISPCTQKPEPLAISRDLDETYFDPDETKFDPTETGTLPIKGACNKSQSGLNHDNEVDDKNPDNFSDLSQSLLRISDCRNENLKSIGIGHLKRAKPKAQAYHETSFDRAPQWREEVPKYAYKEKTVRGKARKQLPAHTCNDCKPFYAAVASSGTEMQNIVDRVSRHRYKFERKGTPPGFWDFSPLH